MNSFSLPGVSISWGGTAERSDFNTYPRTILTRDSTQFIYKFVLNNTPQDGVYDRSHFIFSFTVNDISMAGCFTDRQQTY